MSPKVLRRCTICKKFHAAYLVKESGEERFYCYSCWKAKFAPGLTANPPTLPTKP